MQGDFDELPGGNLTRPAGVTDRTWAEMQAGRRQSEAMRNKSIAERLINEKKIWYVGNGYMVGNTHVPADFNALGNPSDACIATMALLLKVEGVEAAASPPRVLTPAMLRSGRND